MPRADDGIRTRDPHLGKVMRYQLRYVRSSRERFRARVRAMTLSDRDRADPNRLPWPRSRSHSASTAARSSARVEPSFSMISSATARRCSSLGLRGHPRLGVVAGHPAARQPLQARLAVGEHHRRPTSKPSRASPSRRAAGRRRRRPRPRAPRPSSSATRAPTSGCTIALRSAQGVLVVEHDLGQRGAVEAAVGDDRVAEARDDRVVAGRAGLDDLAGDRVGVDDHRAVLGRAARPPCSCPTRLPRSAPPARRDRTGSESATQNAPGTMRPGPSLQSWF